MRHDPLFVKEFQECTESLQIEIVRQLTQLELLLPSPAKVMELENVGPDHNVNDFGRSLSLTMATASDDRDQSQRCYICLQVYTALHPAFTTTKCSHIIGKPCLTCWLNNTSRNANLCPHCRTPLCERCPHGPAGTNLMILNEQRSILNGWYVPITCWVILKSYKRSCSERTQLLNTSTKRWTI